MDPKHIHNSNEDLLQEINENLPAKTCAAHPMMILYIKNITKNVDIKFEELDKKLSPILDYIEELHVEQKAEEKVEKDKRKLMAKQMEVQKRNEKMDALKRWKFEIILLIGAIIVGFFGMNGMHIP